MDASLSCMIVANRVRHDLKCGASPRSPLSSYRWSDAGRTAVGSQHRAYTSKDIDAPEGSAQLWRNFIDGVYRL